MAEVFQVHEQHPEINRLGNYGTSLGAGASRRKAELFAAGHGKAWLNLSSEQMSALDQKRTDFARVTTFVELFADENPLPDRTQTAPIMQRLLADPDWFKSFRQNVARIERTYFGETDHWPALSEDVDANSFVAQLAEAAPRYLAELEAQLAAIAESKEFSDALYMETQGSLMESLADSYRLLLETEAGVTDLRNDSIRFGREMQQLLNSLPENSPERVKMMTLLHELSAEQVQLRMAHDAKYRNP